MNSLLWRVRVFRFFPLSGRRAIEDSSCAGEGCSSSAATSCIWEPFGEGRATVWGGIGAGRLAVRPLVPHMPALPEGLEMSEEVASFSKYFPLSDTTPMFMNEVFFH